MKLNFDLIFTWFLAFSPDIKSDLDLTSKFSFVVDFETKLETAAVYL